MLEEPFSKDEIWTSIQSCNKNRALGPDGFNLNFFKAFCELVKGDVMLVFQDFYMHGKLVRGLNAGLHCPYF